MVYNETKSTGSVIKLNQWVFGIPFGRVSSELIEQLKGREFNYQEYLAWGSLMDKIPTIWTLGLVGPSGGVLAFAYGTWNPLERELEIKRAVVMQELYSVKGEIMRRALPELRKLKEKFNALHLYWITPSAKAYLRKLPDDLKMLTLNVLEVK